MTSKIKWVALRTQPVHRAEFRVARRITQDEFPAMLPCEIVYERRPNRREPVKQEYALFSRYVFAGLQNIEEDYDRLRRSIPEIQGIVSRSRDEWSPLILTQRDVALIAQLVERSSGMTEVDIHKALKPGKTVEVSMGGTSQTTKIDAITKKGVKVLLNMLGSMHVVEVPFDKVRAA